MDERKSNNAVFASWLERLGLAMFVALIVQKAFLGEFTDIIFKGSVLITIGTYTLAVLLQRASSNK